MRKSFLSAEKRPDLKFFSSRMFHLAAAQKTHSFKLVSKISSTSFGAWNTLSHAVWKTKKKFLYQKQPVLLPISTQKSKAAWNDWKDTRGRRHHSDAIFDTEKSKKPNKKNEQRNRRFETRNGHHPTSTTGRHEIKPTSIEGQAKGLSSEDSTIVPARKNVHPSRNRRTRRAPQAKAKPITRCFCHFNKRD